ncbi:MAG: PHP domain-containing protein [Melioribacteraceae bacterium]|nr:PHP domain-containing protein [Melioribacteraceae bacterium]
MQSLHNHSVYSLLTGTIPVESLISFAKKSGSSFVALTDTNAMYGLIHFAKIAKEEGIKPILGAKIDDPKNPEDYLVVIAKNNEGYSELCRLVTTRKLKDDFSLQTAIKNISDNLFFFTSSLEVIRFCIDDKDISTKNLYVELIITEKQKKRTRELYNFAKSKNLKILASHPTYFASKNDFLLHKVVTAIRENKTLENLDESLLVDEESFLQSSEEFRAKWKALPEAIWNIEDIVRNSNVDLEFGKYKFPLFPLPTGETPFSYLWKISFRGLEARFKPITEKAVKRLQYELEVIDELGFCDYFLVVWDIVREAHSRRMVTIGRGSAANSLVAYCLGLTQVDPLEHNLYFERFLNRGRTSPPDVDLDFSWKERDEIVKYVFEKYGYDKVAMISTHVTFRARSAFRETAKVFGISNREISKYSKFIPWTSAKNLPELAKKFPESKSLSFENEPWSTIIEIASKLSGFPRHLSIHPGGIVITKNPITSYVGLEYAQNKGLGIIVTQPDMYPIEDMGLIKIDLLSQRSLGVLRDTLDKLEKRTEKRTDVRLFNLNAEIE